MVRLFFHLLCWITLPIWFIPFVIFGAMIDYLQEIIAEDIDMVKRSKGLWKLLSAVFLLIFMSGCLALCPNCLEDRRADYESTNTEKIGDGMVKTTRTLKWIHIYRVVKTEEYERVGK